MEYSSKWTRQNYSYEWVPAAAFAVDGHKGDVASLLTGPSILFNDNLDDCKEWCRLGFKGNEARLVDRKRPLFDNYEPWGAQLWPSLQRKSPQDLLAKPERITYSQPVYAAAMRSSWR